MCLYFLPVVPLAWLFAYLNAVPAFCLAATSCRLSGEVKASWNSFWQKKFVVAKAGWLMQSDFGFLFLASNVRVWTVFPNIFLCRAFCPDKLGGHFLWA